MTNTLDNEQRHVSFRVKVAIHLCRFQQGQRATALYTEPKEAVQ